MQLKKCTQLNVREKVEIIHAAVLPSVLYGLEFSQTLHRSKGKLQSINSTLARFAQTILGVSLRSSKIKALIETTIAPIEFWIIERQMLQWRRYFKIADLNPLVATHLNRIEGLKTQFYRDQNRLFAVRGLNVNCSKKEISDVLRTERNAYLLEQLTHDHGNYNISDLSRATFQPLVYKIDSIPQYLVTDWISQHPGTRVITKLRVGHYVDGNGQRIVSYPR